MYISKLVLMFFVTFLGLSPVVSAHALFIDTQPVGRPGVAREVTVFYAEIEDGKWEAVEDWWADVSAFTLWLHHPDGRKEALEVTAREDHFTAVFVPETPGRYTLSISHTVNQLAGSTQYVFNASAQVLVGKNQPAQVQDPVPLPQMLLIDDFDRLKPNREISLRYFVNEEPSEESSLSIFSPSGWQKKIRTGTGGTATFVPEWKGGYYIEGIHKSKAENKPYKEVVQIYTTRLDVG